MEPTTAHLKAQTQAPAEYTYDKHGQTGAPGTVRPRVFWLLRMAGWGMSLALALAILVNEVLQVSQQRTDFCQGWESNAESGCREPIANISAYLSLLTHRLLLEGGEAHDQP